MKNITDLQETKKHLNINTAGWILILIYAFTWTLALDISRTAETLLLILFIIYIFKSPKHTIPPSKIPTLLALFVLIQAHSLYASYQTYPDFFSEQIKPTRQLTKLFYCFIIAAWINGNIEKTKKLITTFLAGSLVYLLINVSYADISSILSGQRVDFNFMNAQHTSMLFGFGLIYSFALTAIIIKDKRKIALSLPLILFCTIGVIVTQTRAVWLSIILCYLSTIALYLISNKQIHKSIKILIPVLTLSIASIFIIAKSDIVGKRIKAEFDIVSMIPNSKIEDIPLTSIGIRLHTWKYAAEKISERPLLGWGAKTRKYLIQDGPFPQHIKERFGHFHNSYLEILLAYGILGFLILTYLISLCINGAYKLIKSENRSTVIIGYSLLASWVFFLTVNTFESYIIFYSGLYSFIILGSASLTFYLNSKHINGGAK